MTHLNSKRAALSLISEAPLERKALARLIGVIVLTLMFCGSALAQSPEFYGTTEYTTTMQGPPSMAVFNSRIYLGFQANDSSNILYLKVSDTSGNFSAPATGYSNYVMQSSPRLGSLANYLFVTYASTGNVEAPTVLWMELGQGGFTEENLGQVGGECGLTTFNNQELLLCSLNNVLTVFTFNGAGFTQTATAAIPSGGSVGAPSAVQFNGSLYVALGNTSSAYLEILKSSDGVHFTATTYTTMVGSAPSIAVFNSELQVAFQTYNFYDYLFIKTSDTSGNFSQPATEYATQIGGTPALTLFNGDLYLAFIAANGTKRLFTTYATPGS